MSFSRRYLPLFDVDLNRTLSFDNIDPSFAGPIGSFIVSLANHIKDYNYVIDLHAGNKWLEYEPRIVIIQKEIRDEEKLKERIKLAKEFNLPYISIITPEADPNILNTLNYIVNAEQGKFGFTVEFGLGLRLNRFLIIRVFMPILKFFIFLGILDFPQGEFNNVLFSFIKENFIFTNQETTWLEEAIKFDEITPHILLSSHIVNNVEKIPGISMVSKHIEIKAPSSGFFVTEKHLGETVTLSPTPKESDLGYIFPTLSADPDPTIIKPKV